MANEIIDNLTRRIEASNENSETPELELVRTDIGIELYFNPRTERKNSSYFPIGVVIVDEGNITFDDSAYNNTRRILQKEIATSTKGMTKRGKFRFGRGILMYYGLAFANFNNIIKEIMEVE